MKLEASFMRRLNVVRGLFVLVSLAGTHQALSAADCGTMLQPYFDWIVSSDHSYTHTVYATMTKQASAGNTTLRTQDPVWYANGPVLKTYLGWSLALGRDLQLQTNSSHFQVNTANTMALLVNQAGYVSVQQKIDGKPVGGMPPVTFAGQCSDGLITAEVGGSAYIISFTRSQEPNIY